MREYTGIVRETCGGDCKRNSDKKRALEAYGPLATCRDVIRAYENYRYNLFKEKYESYGRKH